MKFKLVPVFKMFFVTFICTAFFTELQAQEVQCRALHQGKFKIIISKDAPTWSITRTISEQVEKSSDGRVYMIYSITWIDDCTYDLRPKKLITGDPSLMGNGTNVVRNKILRSTSESYEVEISSNFSDAVMNVRVQVLK